MSVCVLLNAATISLPEALPDPDTMKNNNTDFSTTHQLQKLMCNRVSVVKDEWSPPCAASPNSVLHSCRGSETLEKGLKEKQREREKETERGFISPSRCRAGS